MRTRMSPVDAIPGARGTLDGDSVTAEGRDEGSLLIRRCRNELSGEEEDERNERGLHARRSLVFSRDTRCGAPVHALNCHRGWLYP